MPTIKKCFTLRFTYWSLQALGSIFFVHKHALSLVEQFDFARKQFVPLPTANSVGISPYFSLIRTTFLCLNQKRREFSHKRYARKGNNNQEWQKFPCFLRWKSVRTDWTMSLSQWRGSFPNISGQRLNGAERDICTRDGSLMESQILS